MADVMCNRCGKYGHVARSCSRPPTCFRCGRLHFARDCPEYNKVSCHRCGKSSHLVSECPEPPNHLACHRCGQTGHLARECTQFMVCLVCGKTGHLMRNCPKKPYSALAPVEEEKKEPTKQIPKFNNEAYCFNCGCDGHWARDCWRPREAAKPKPQFTDVTVENTKEKKKRKISISAVKTSGESGGRVMISTKKKKTEEDGAGEQAPGRKGGGSVQDDVPASGALALLGDYDEDNEE
mmetsp:Transcript_28862/g.72634  ORF Transcript_28862/g.72634 Transcript_28862/m.72634 type:complete len:237 (-) Transcript_28862:104-814(-)